MERQIFCTVGLVLFLSFVSTSFADTEVAYEVKDFASDIDAIFLNLRHIIRTLGLDKLNITIPQPEPQLRYPFHFDTTHKKEAYKCRGLLESSTGGFFYGLDTIHRAGEAYAQKEPNNDTFMKIDMGMHDLMIEYTLPFDINGTSLMITAKGKLSRTLIDMGFRTSPSASAMELTVWKIVDLGNMTITVTGLGLLDFLANLIIPFLEVPIKDALTEAIEGPVRDLINDLLRDIIKPDKFFLK